MFNRDFALNFAYTWIRFSTLRTTSSARAEGELQRAVKQLAQKARASKKKDIKDGKTQPSRTARSRHARYLCATALTQAGHTCQNTPGHRVERVRSRDCKKALLEPAGASMEEHRLRVSRRGEALPSYPPGGQAAHVCCFRRLHSTLNNAGLPCNDGRAGITE